MVCAQPRIPRVQGFSKRLHTSSRRVLVESEKLPVKVPVKQFQMEVPTRGSN